MSETKGETKQSEETRLLYGKSIDELKASYGRVEADLVHFFKPHSIRTEPHFEVDLEPAGLWVYRDPLSASKGIDVIVSSAEMILEGTDGKLTYAQLRDAVLDRAWRSQALFATRNTPDTGPEADDMGDFKSSDPDGPVASSKHFVVRDREVFVNLFGGPTLCYLRALPLSQESRLQDLHSALYDRKWNWFTERCIIGVLTREHFSLRPEFDCWVIASQDGEGCDSHDQLASYAMWECHDDGSAVPVPCDYTHKAGDFTVGCTFAAQKISARVTMRPQADLRCGVMYAVCVNDWDMWERHARARDFPVWRHVTESAAGSLLPAPVLAVVESYVSVDGPPLMRLRSKQGKLPFETLGGRRCFFQLREPEDPEVQKQHLSETYPSGKLETELFYTMQQQLEDSLEEMEAVTVEPDPEEEAPKAVAAKSGEAADADDLYGA